MPKQTSSVFKYKITEKSKEGRPWRLHIPLSVLLNDEITNNSHNISIHTEKPLEDQKFKEKVSGLFNCRNFVPKKQKRKELNSGEKATSVRKGWTKEEHLKFLLGVYMHGKGNWKKVSQFIRGKTPKQVQSHAQKYFLRQQQAVKMKKSVHDFSFEDAIKLVNDKQYRKGVDPDLERVFQEFEQFMQKTKKNNELNVIHHAPFNTVYNDYPQTGNSNIFGFKTQ